MPFFSIIIPTYNSDKDIIRCCTSIVNQTCKDYEIIVQDALSGDTTLELLLQFKQLHPAVPVHVRSEKDKGIYDAMNKAIKRANGEWVYFLGSDDEIYDEHVFQKIFDVCSKNDADVVYGNVFSDRFNGVYDGEFTMEKLFEKNICHQAIFMKKTALKNIGYFNLKYKGHADWEHNMRWFLSDTISKKYIDLIISRYEDGGFSSIHGDSVFEKEKVLKFLISGRRNIQFNKKLSMLKSLTGYALLIKDYRLMAKIVFYSPHILL